MKRDLQKAVEDYKREFCGRCKLNLADSMQIWEMSNGSKSKCIDNALMAGFMIGYRYAKRESKKGRA